MTQVNTRWFQDKLKIRDIDQKTLARSLKLNPAAITLMLKGKRKIKMEEAVSIANLFGVSLEEVLAAAGMKTSQLESRQTLSITGWIDGEMRIHWESPKGPKNAPLPAISARNLRCLRYHTTGTALETLDGGLIYFLDVKEVAPDSLGKLCVVELVKGTGRSGVVESMLGVIKRGYGPGSFNLTDLSGKMLREDVSLKSASPVVWIKV